MESKTPVHKQRRTCVECGLESSPGGLGLHQKATGHKGWKTPNAYALMISMNDRDIDAEMKKAVEVALSHTKEQYDKSLADIYKKHRQEVSELGSEISDMERRVGTFRLVSFILLIALAASLVFLVYFGLVS